MNIVITGINGFVGKHLTRELKSAGHLVMGVGQEESIHPEITDELLEYAVCDLAESWPVFTNTPDAVIHLAGLAAVGPSFDNPQAYINLNSAMVTHMCEFYLKSETKPRIVIVSSGAIYDPTQEMPLRESSALTFNSPYSVSKILVENQAAYYRTRGLDSVVMRPFNHVGPGQLPGFLVPDLAEKIRTRKSSSDDIEVGNLATKRDYTDVRDVVAAYRLVATKPDTLAHNIYNVCSGVSISGETVLETITHVMGIEKPITKINPAFMRPNDILDIKGDNSRLVSEFGWELQYSFDDTIRDFTQSFAS